MRTLIPAVRHSRTAAGTVGRKGSAIPTRTKNANGNPLGVSGRAKSVGTDPLATARTRMPSRAISSTAARDWASSGWERWQSSAIASGAPMAATIRSSEPALDLPHVALAPEVLPGAQRNDCPPVLGERAGLVGAEHRRRAKCLYRGDAPGQDAGSRNTPGTHHHEDRQDERELLRQHRHAERDAAQQRIQPPAAPQAVQQHGEGAEAEAHGGKIANQAA